MSEMNKRSAPALFVDNELRYAGQRRPIAL
ncbi:MAG: hypothetical protein JWN62_693 [Acidimicrobiales bacterium]|nr:hypothetical protein [Acidimicrobiales bacterium]